MQKDRQTAGFGKQSNAGANHQHPAAFMPLSRGMGSFQSQKIGPPIMVGAGQETGWHDNAGGGK